MTRAIEKALGAALRGEGGQGEQQRPSRVSGLRVVLSVRLRDGGLPFRFEYAAGTISRLAAECDAKKAAREAGLIVWAVIEISEDE